MIKFIQKIIKSGRATDTRMFPDLDEFSRGLPDIKSESSCTNDQCNNCVSFCPTSAISVDNSKVNLDLGNCIACGVCLNECPLEIFQSNLSTRTARSKRSDLVLPVDRDVLSMEENKDSKNSIFKDAVSIRVVSTGCSACDLEVGAAFNAIFDAERFGVKVVASPRMADILLVTGPVGDGMKSALLRTFDAMPDPRIVIAAGACAISGGVHKNGYANANLVQIL